MFLCFLMHSSSLLIPEHYELKGVLMGSPANCGDSLHRLAVYSNSKTQMVASRSLLTVQTYSRTKVLILSKDRGGREDGAALRMYMCIRADGLIGPDTVASPRVCAIRAF